MDGKCFMNLMQIIGGVVILTCAIILLGTSKSSALPWLMIFFGLLATVSGIAWLDTRIAWLRRGAPRA